MSKPDKKCTWCTLEHPLSQGRMRNGDWVCYTCFPQDAGFITCVRKCDICGNKANQGTVAGRNFFCVNCSGQPLYSNHKHTNAKKKSRKGWYQPSQPEPEVYKKGRKNKQEYHEPPVKIERWKVLIEDITTGEL
jgi:hypothetical protein